MYRFYQEIIATCYTSLTEQIVNTLGKRLGNEVKQLYFTQLCFISFQKSLCGPLPKDHCFKTVTLSLQILYRMPEATSSTGYGALQSERLGAGPSSAIFTAMHSKYPDYWHTLKHGDNNSSYTVLLWGLNGIVHVKHVAQSLTLTLDPKMQDVIIKWVTK